MSEQTCDHGVTYDEAEGAKVLSGWKATTALDFIMGNPAHQEIRQRWPRLCGVCPKGCGYHGIAYASYAHYMAGDW